MTGHGDRQREFETFCLELAAKQKTGRRSLRRPWTALRKLFDSQVSPQLTEAEVRRLIGRRIDELDPEENDLKALAAYVAGRGSLDPVRLQEALSSDRRAAPLSFLAGLSGKAFGESVSPELCRFWVVAEGDGWTKQSAGKLYDVLWTPSGSTLALLIEIKASSESPEFRFQQVRSPRAGYAETDVYDALLCLGVTASILEFWLIPAATVMSCIESGVFAPQHGGRKQGLASNTYWFTMTPEVRVLLKPFMVDPDDLRDRALVLAASLP